MCNGNLPPADAGLQPAKAAAGAGGTKIISKSELASHNTPSSAWCAVHATDANGTYTGGHLVLDITSFASRHPGGDLILLAAGKDASVLLETYHPRGVPHGLLKKLQIGVMEKGSYDDSFYSWDSDFYKVLKRRVVARIEERGLARRGSAEIWIKALLLLAGFWGSLYQMHRSEFKAAMAWSIVMGFFAAMIGTNIQHDGNHGAFAQSKFINKCAGWTLDMIGASAFTWELQHMLGHHPYTNVLDGEEEMKKEGGVDCKLEEKDQESDPDVFSSFPLMRMHPLHEPSWYNRYQHLYAPLLFSLMTLAKVFQQDYEVAVSKRLYHIDANVRYGSWVNVIRFWGMKMLTSVYMMGLPIYFHGLAKGMALFVVGHMACGELLATMFIVNHVIEGVSYAKKDLKGAEGEAKEKAVGKPVTMLGDTPMERTRRAAIETKGKGAKAVPSVPFNDWAAVQCQTSVNWAPGSWFWNHFSGGLSHQIEHHLFPSICHTNYAYIHDVVESTCAEYGVPYQAEPSLWVAYGKMLSHLRNLGRGKAE